MNIGGSKIKYIQNAIDEIKDAAKDKDWEVAHSLLDRLYIFVLSEIANGNCYDAMEAAQLALTVEDLKLTLWFA